MLRVLAVSAFIFCLNLPVRADEKSDSSTLYADLVVFNGRIWTVDRSKPECEALAIVRDRIVAVGKDAELRRMMGPKTPRP